MQISCNRPPALELTFNTHLIKQVSFVVEFASLVKPAEPGAPVGGKRWIGGKLHRKFDLQTGVALVSPARCGGGPKSCKKCAKSIQETRAKSLSMPALLFEGYE